MGYKIPARLDAIRLEANRLSPHRRTNSDGTVGDPRHFANGGDHVPEPDPGTSSPLVVHAIDISQSMPGTAYFLPGMGEFDVWSLCYRIVGQYVATSDADRRRRWAWLHPSGGGYIVWGDPKLGYDVIFNPSHPSGPTVRRNVGTGREHIDAPHSHFSIGHNAQSENDTQPIFGAASTPEDDDMTPAELKAALDAQRDQIKSDTKALIYKAVPQVLLGYTDDDGDEHDGILEEYVDSVLGGYVDGHYKPGALREDLVIDARKARGLSSTP